MLRRLAIVGIIAIFAGASLAVPAFALGAADPAATPGEDSMDHRQPDLPRRPSEGPFDHSGPYLPPILDFLLLRPPAIVATALDLALWSVMLPFNVFAQGDVLKNATETFIEKPARYAFIDRLGSH